MPPKNLHLVKVSVKKCKIVEFPSNFGCELKDHDYCGSNIFTTFKWIYMLSEKLFIVFHLLKLGMWLSCKFVLCPSVYTGLFPVLRFFSYLFTDVVTESKQIKYHGCQNARLYINANNALSASLTLPLHHMYS